GIAQIFALAGHAVRIADVTAEVARSNYERICTESRELEDAGLLPRGATDTIGVNLEAAPSLDAAVDGAEFIEEAVPEVLEIKHETLRRISAANASATICSNTSTIAIATLAEAITAPERFLGVHFSNPAPFIPGVEVIPHVGTD